MQFHEIINFITNNKLGSQPPPPSCFYSLNIIFCSCFVERLCAILMNFFLILATEEHVMNVLRHGAKQRNDLQCSQKEACKINLLGAIFLLESFINIYRRDLNHAHFWDNLKNNKKLFSLKVPDSKLNNISFLCFLNLFFPFFPWRRTFSFFATQKSFHATNFSDWSWSQSRGCAEVSWKRDGKIGRRRRMQRRWGCVVVGRDDAISTGFLRNFPNGRINKTNWLMHLQKL